MFDNLRDDSAGAFYEEDDSDLLFPEDEAPKPEKKSKAPLFKPRGGGQKIFGMTAQQRLIIAVMLMFAVCSLGAMCLLITGKIAFF